MFEKIVAGVHGGPGGRDALALATALAGATGAELVVAYAWRPDPKLPAAAREATEEAARRRLDEETADAPAGARAVLAAGEHVATSLHRLAELEGADLLVIGSSRRSAAGRVLLGDVARAVVRGAPCAVAVAPRDHADLPAAIRLIGVGVDGSPLSLAALDAARDLARRAGAALRIAVAIGPPLPPATPYPYGYLSTWQRYVERAREDGQAVLDAALAGSDVPVDGSVISQSPGTALPALSRDCDLLVLGARRRTGLRGLLLGSVADALLGSAHCPVVVVPATVPDTRPASLIGGTVMRR